MIHRFEDELVLEHLRRLVAQIEPVSDDQCRSMARAAARTAERDRSKRWGRRGFLAVISTSVLVGGGIAAGAVTGNLGKIRQDTGIYENRPARATRTWTAAQLPYLSVQPLMHYVGVDQPVVPTASIVTRDGKRIVFVLASVPNELPDQHGRVKVTAVPVTIGEAIGKATIISSGLTACAEVVAEPPAALQPGDSIETYIGGSEDSLRIDFRALFGARAAAPLPRIQGGIAHQAGPGEVTVNVVDEQPSKTASVYLYSGPDGTTQQIPYSSSVDFTVATAHLRQGKPIGTITILSNAGGTIATGHLEWYC